jgi:hypothetical protein
MQDIHELTLHPDHRCLRPTPIHTFPSLQRNRTPARTPLRRGKRRELHHRLRNRRILPPARILHSQRRTPILPNSFQAPPSQRPRARVPRQRRKHARRRARHSEHTLYTPSRRAQWRAATQPFACRQLSEPIGARGAQVSVARHSGRRSCILCRLAFAQHQDHDWRLTASLVQRQVVSEYDVATGLVWVWWTHLHQHVAVLFVECGCECGDMYCVFQRRGFAEAVEAVYD